MTAAPRRAACLLALAAGLLAPGAAAQQPPLVTVAEVQGASTSSPLVGQTVRVRGLVTIDLVEATSSGFFLQDPQGDGDEATSEGVWVYDARKLGADSVPGDLVEVSGKVVEYFGLTEVQLADVTALPPPEPGVRVAPTILEPPADEAAAAAYLEAREGMLVRLPPSRVVGATNHFGESYVVPAGGGPTRIFRHTPEGRRLGLVPATWLSLDHGDVVDGLEGALTFSFGNFKVVLGPSAAPLVTPSGRQPEREPPAAAGELTIGTYNLENFFDPVDDPGKNDTEWTPTPARYAIDVARRAQSIAENLGSPDLLGVQEVEKLGVLEDLAADPALADADYGAVLLEGEDARGIDVGLLYDRSRLRLLTAEARQECTTLAPTADLDKACTTPDGRAGHVLFGRPPLVSRLEVVAGGARLTVIVNHFKSKSGDEAVNLPVRIAMADFNGELVGRLRAMEPRTPVIVLGDLNDFEDSEPVRRLAATGGLNNLHELVPPDEDYTFIFNGVSQSLDHVLVPSTIEVTRFGPVHTNADFGSPDPAAVTANSDRVSDHDPLVARLAPLPERHSAYLPIAARESAVGDVFEPPIATRAATQPADATATPTAAPGPTPTASPTASAGPPRSPVRIEAIFSDGVMGSAEPDEYVEIANVSAARVGLGGWQLLSVGRTGVDQTFAFAAGSGIDAGARCRVYTDEDHPELACSFRWGSGSAVWANGGDKAEIRDPSGALVDWFCYGDRVTDCR